MAAVIVTSGHLCAGYDGLGMALDRTGLTHEPAWYAESEPDAAAILKRVEPDVPNLGDITVDGLDFAPVDILTAGIPCQPVSVQGKKRGKADKRWLWPYARAAYRAARPFRILLENVGNMVTIEGGRLHDEILRDLREDGYAVRWTVVGACQVGAAHHRHRWFLLADHVGVGSARPAEQLAVLGCGYPRRLGRLLPTPRAGDEKRGVEPDRAARTGTGPTLNDAVGTLPPGSWGIYADAIARHEAALGRPAPGPVDEHGRLSGAFSEWLMMLPAGHLTAELPRQDVVRLAGNGVVPAQAAHAYRLLSSRSTLHTY
jgi:DNA (cytosine-5)-methyltransferase 1